MKIGATSYLYPADVLTNVRRIAELVDDVEIVLFQADAPSDLPSPDEVAALRSIAETHDLSYTIHFPLDIAPLGADPAYDKIRACVRGMRELKPYGYVIHPDGHSMDESMSTLMERASVFFDFLQKELGGWDPICVENLTEHSPELMSRILAEFPVRTCLDIGHLVMAHTDPVPLIRERAARTSIVHLHGVSDRDHRSLAVMAPEVLDPIVKELYKSFQGVLTIEVFRIADLLSSREALRDSLARCGIIEQKLYNAPARSGE
jgi:sugar phosphate isomerase/epimerase